ncbi:TPA: glycosyltransferase [Photobacterium damselae]|uniref:glycosyltransferase n=1 Tax=Photobacterium damselae TaxID=38293 RepID=UPI00370CF255
MEIKKLSAPFSEEEIQKHWKYTDKVYISCVCITFNQSGYIRDAIDGFLAQKTDYRFEIVIHDDVSTDGTRDILLEYKRKYPSIIKLILQDKNQFQLGFKIIPIAISHSCGDYIALCEGDDYWIRSDKIDNQYKTLIRSKKDLAFTRVIEKKKGLYRYSQYLYNNSNITPDEIIKNGGNACATCSIMISRAAFDSLPKWVLTAPVLDLYLQAYCSIYSNGAIYDSSCYSVYRLESAGSWTNSNVKSILKSYDFLNELEKSYIKFNNDTKGIYKKSINTTLGMSYLNLAFLALKKCNCILFIRCLYVSFDKLKLEFPHELYRLLIRVIFRERR